jgi:hypothetical protein
MHNGSGGTIGIVLTEGTIHKSLSLHMPLLKLKLVLNLLVFLLFLSPCFLKFFISLCLLKE